jgi:hypothetical protein
MEVVSGITILMHFLQLAITPNLWDIHEADKEQTDRSEEDFSMIYCQCEGKKKDDN